MAPFKGFSSVQLQKPKRSDFDLTHQRRMTVRAGDIVPILCAEAIPGDRFRGDSRMIVRLLALLAPIYDDLIVYVHYFFVPYRLIWEDWETFITGGRLGVGVDPVDAPIPPYVKPYTVNGWFPDAYAKGTLQDYLGMPVMAPDISWINIKFDVMAQMAYQLTWYEFYRDRNYISDDIFSFPFPSGEVTTESVIQELHTLRVRDYLPDYFTSALPFTQRGGEVLLPTNTDIQYKDQSELYYAGGGLVNSSGNITSEGGTIPGVIGVPPLGAAGRIENIESIGTGTINDLRTAYALQVWLERNAIGGSRYTESIQAHFAVKPQDYRLQRPEFLGGGRIKVKISEVVNTAWSTDADDASVPAGNLSGHGVTFGDINKFSYFCSEHGMVLGLLSIMAPASYHQGLPRMFNQRRSFLDYPWPTFAKLGEQEVAKCEIFANVATLDDTVIEGELPLFGYQSRYADWKYIPNTSHGDFHDDYMFWTLTREFADVPTLGEEFVNFDQTTQDRIFAVTGQRNFLLWIQNRLTVNRALPYFGTPNQLGFN